MPTAKVSIDAQAKRASGPLMENLAYTMWLCPSPKNICRMFLQPKVYVALGIAIPCGLAGMALKYYNDKIDEGRFQGVITDSAAFSILTMLVVFVATFRIDAAYLKFWDGTDYTYNINGDLFDGASDLLAFTRCAKASREAIAEYHGLVIRLVSLLHALICADLERGAGRLDPSDDSLPNSYNFELIDIDAIDQDSLDRLAEAENKVEMVFMWIQNTAVEAWNKDIFGVPGPVMTRAFEDLGNGLVHFHEAQKITEVPYPFPFMMALQILLITHWCLSPFVMVNWSSHYAWVFGFCASSQFALWLFVGLSMELDLPYHFTSNSLDMRYMQRLLNHRLLTLQQAYAMDTPSLDKSKAMVIGTTAEEKNATSTGIGEVLKQRRSVRAETA
eukprot:TRINITY_DN9234_c1_g1_i1.p1 TRINITY_DN9234_c1_g1~~TRINITY_DN9234_c1_g1_i1.p1  ORF type:complete len:414 (-),score=78.20 TRINITY_DN9234_c1_g1_i1:120-1283(-)